MSIIDSWYCQRCGTRNIAGGLTEKCSMCNEPRALPGIAVRDDGAEQIIERLENRIAKLEQEALADEDRMHDALTTIDEQRASINSQTEEILQLQSKLEQSERLASDLKQLVHINASRLASCEKALQAMVDDGWLYIGPEGASEAQKLVIAALPDSPRDVERLCPVCRRPELDPCHRCQSE